MKKANFFDKLCEANYRYSREAFLAGHIDRMLKN